MNMLIINLLLILNNFTQINYKTSIILPPIFTNTNHSTINTKLNT